MLTLPTGAEPAAGGKTTNDHKLPPHVGAHPARANSFVIARRDR